MYKKALHSFFLRVHPDFFGAHPNWRRTNEVSIASLNEVLEWAKSFKAGRLSPPPSKKFTLEFYRKTDSDEQTSTFATQISATFELPSSFQPLDSNKGAAERAVNKFLRELLRKARCLDDEEAMVSQAQDETQAREEKRFHAHRKPSSAEKTKTLLDEAAESLISEWGPKNAPDLDDLMLHDQILFSRDLSPTQCAAALQQLQQLLPSMSYDRWHHMPLIIGEEFGVSEVVMGSLTIPWNFTLNRFLSFLNANEDLLEKGRQTLMNRAKRIEGLISSLCRQLELDDVLLTNVKSADAVKTLQLIHDLVPDFQLANVKGVSLEIADIQQCAHRANGVVLIGINQTEASLREFLRVMQPRMAALQEVYRDAKRMIDSTLWHLKKFREIINPAVIDSFPDSVPYYHRLQWAKELVRLAPQIARWDWSDFTFALGPLDIDWDNCTVTLPHNFDATSFARYVGEMHEQSKKQEREKLSEGEQLRLQFEAKKTAQELQDELARSEEKTVETASEAYLHPAGKPRTAFFEVAETGRPSRVANDAVAREGAFRSEYLAPSKLSENGLRTERPLHHQVHFDTEEDARDQLEWEGFYQDPYTALEPDSAYDDVMMTYLRTNRKLRESTIKKYVAELKEHSSKAFRHKLGDITGINDPDKKPKGAPVLVKGTYLGERGASQ
jgi:hypothetical protein